MKRTMLILALTVPFSSCGDIGRGMRVACGFADVLVTELDLDKVEMAFSGEASAGKKLCRAVRAYSDSTFDDGIPAGGVEKAAIPLPTGDVISVEIEPR